MRERHWYSRFGIEPPFPWPAFVLIPVGWVTRALEWLVRPGKSPTPVDVIESREDLGPYTVPEYLGSKPEYPWVIYLEDDRLAKVIEIVRDMQSLAAHSAFISRDPYDITDALTEALGLDWPDGRP
ncbi:hypothetical protein [Mycobacterium intracellulare]|uniref:Uncharacterized protein n=1 Tax=Mycobacterium intracellulare TaxID=1767 RepID=A0AAE4RAX8_MYCIT|nr:hypothetical protein [Mycobacterium intracellulare]MDV6975271.1 hypothetical protein [Mycobacterium intracellulare]MDV6980335.1 hypothetical protein [Mycobacterium intracellulare]MDV7010764.1 hypothetical protein [Mycobacterium intracellulare]MDV7025670.1 hypothetical protein [Mycobacterium intracellulare]